MSGCIFCKIISGEIPCKKVFENQDVIGFHDISPQAPTHLLFVPKTHVESLAEVTDPAIVAQLFGAALECTRKMGIKDHFRIAINTGVAAGQSVFHLHLHFMAGKQMRPGMC